MKKYGFSSSFPPKVGGRINLYSKPIGESIEEE